MNLREKSTTFGWMGAFFFAIKFYVDTKEFNLDDHFRNKKIML